MSSVPGANAEDVSSIPTTGADPRVEVEANISEDVYSLYDVYSYRHAASILRHSFSDELSDLEDALRNFRMTTADIGMPGGNESTIPKRVSEFLRPKNWYETRIQGDLVVRIREQSETLEPNGKLKKHSLPERDPQTIENYIDGHKIDYVKGRVAFDMEWNSKDQTFDRDLYAFRLFHECGVISAAVMLTRSESLNAVFASVPRRLPNGQIKLNSNGEPETCKLKYGASTTWMGKLLYRMNAGRHGGCPVLVFGIRPDIITDWPLPDAVGS